MPRKTYVDIFIEQEQASDGQTYLVLRAGRNGEPLLTSETYRRPASMRHTSDLLSGWLNGECYAEVRLLDRKRAKPRKRKAKAKR